MKKTIFLVLLLSASILAGVLYSCSEHPQDSDDRTAADRPDFSLDEVRSAFESVWARVPQTRAGEEFDDDKILAPGQVDPEWDALEVGYGNSDRTVIQAEVPFGARYEYRSVRRTEDGKPSFSELPSRLVVLKDSETGETSSWLFFLISDAGGWLPNDPADFSGVALYTTLSGTPVCAGRFYCGEFVGSASLLDESRSREENADKLAELLPKDIFVARIGPAIATRNSDTSTDYNFEMEAIEVVGIMPVKILEPKPTEEWNKSPDVSPFENMNHLPVYDVGGGGGGGSNSKPSSTYSKNPNISASKEIKAMLDELYEDCMGRTLINSITANVSIVNVWERHSSRTIRKETTYTYPDGTKSVICRYTLEMGTSLSNISLMEELTHVYQFSHGADPNYLLNMEVEAKLGWFAYQRRVVSLVDSSKALGGRQGERYFDCMWEHLLKNDLNSPEFLDVFDKAADALRNIKAYSDKEKYRYDPYKKDCENLLDLMKDC